MLLVVVGQPNNETPTKYEFDFATDYSGEFHAGFATDYLQVGGTVITKVAIA